MQKKSQLICCFKNLWFVRNINRIWSCN